jgi:lysozyme
MEKMADLLERHEGRRRFAYKDSVGKLTIGIGFNIDDEGLYPEEMDWILRNRIQKIYNQLLYKIPEFRDLSCVRQMVLVDMTYNMGLPRLMGFKKTLTAIAVGDYLTAAREMLDSKWATQVGGRAIRLARMMRTGEWLDSG